MAAGPLSQHSHSLHHHGHGQQHHGPGPAGLPGSQGLLLHSGGLGIAQPGSLHLHPLHRQITQGPDTVRRLLADLCRTGSHQEAMVLRKHVEEEARDLGGEAYQRFMENFYESIQKCLASEDVYENLGAVRAIDDLIDVRLGENASKVARFAGYLGDVFETKRDFETLVAASSALGHLVHEGGALTIDVVEFQLTRSLSWLQGERVEHRRFAAVHILKEMAEHASTVFNIHVSEFIDAVWVALRDPSLAIREGAVEALRACLRVIETRETRWRVQWYYRMFEATQDGLAKNANVESIHGSLLAVGELLRNTGDFMMSRYKEVAAIVFKYREHRDKLVRRSITALLPRIADFLRDRFINSYLTICMEHLLAVMRNPTERASGFDALGEMAQPIGRELKSYLPVIAALLRDAIAPRRGKPCPSAIACVGCLAEALKSDMEEHVRGLLDPMFAAGLTPILVESLTKIGRSMDSLLPKIQEKLLETISYVLAKTPYRSTKGVVRSASSPTLQPLPDIPGPALTQLALRTLAEFNLTGHELLEFARESVVAYLDDEDPVTRRDAAICCCRLVEHSVSTAEADAAASRLWTTQSPRGIAVGFRRRRHLIEEILEKLLVAAVADTDAGVRSAIYLALSKNRSFEDFLAQADSLRAVFISLNDESFEVRERAIIMAGRLAEKNPAYVLPALRRHLLQLLRDLEQSPESKSREESAKLLGCLIKACERLMAPYITPVLKTLIAKLGDGLVGSGNNGVVTGVLATVGELARVGGLAIVPDLPSLMPRIVDALMDGASSTKREVAVSTLGKIAASTGYVVAPYRDHPTLLGVLLRLLDGDLKWSTRQEVLKVLGIMGALDPHIHKQNLQKLPGPYGEGARGTASESGTLVRSVEELPVELWQSGGLSGSSDDYYPTVAINALIRILREPSHSSYHMSVVKSLMYIFKAMGLASVPYLPRVMPDLLVIVRSCDEGLREYIVLQLAVLVSIVKQHIRKHLDDVLVLISDYWTTMILPASSRPNAGSPILNLVQQLCLALNDEFRTYLPELLPRCLQLLNDPDSACVPQALQTLEVFGASLDDHLHLVLPALVRLFTPDASNASLEIQRASLRTMSHLLPSMQVSGHVSTLIHPLMRILDGTIDELRKDAVDALCALAVALGSDFYLFVSSVRKLLQKHHLQHPLFDEIEHRLRRREPIAELHLPSRMSSVTAMGDGMSLAGNSVHGVDSESERYELDATGSFRSLKMNEGHLRNVWETSKRSTKDDWSEWMRHFSVELLKESPSPALRTCAGLAQVQPYMARELFAAAFVSCWGQLNEPNQDQLVRSLNSAFMSPNIPPEILATLLNLAEFMEHDEKELPIDIRNLGALAEKCHAFAKALRYKEVEFAGLVAGLQAVAKDAQPSLVVESLIHINNQLNQHEAAVGILTYARQQSVLGDHLKESWYEKLQRWEEALAAYEGAWQVDDPHAVLERTLGKMRCLAALARWDELSDLCRRSWAASEGSARRQMAPMAASAAWNLGKWEEMNDYVQLLGDGDDVNVRLASQTLPLTVASDSGASDGAFFRAVMRVHHGEEIARMVREEKWKTHFSSKREAEEKLEEEYNEAKAYIENARKILATEVAALVLESYDRAYTNMVRIQQLVELEEVMDYSLLKDENVSRKGLIRKMWSDRIQGTKRKVEVWQALLSVRTLVLPPEEDISTWLKFSSLCRKSGRIGQARATLVKLLKYDPEAPPQDGLVYASAPEVMLGYYKYQWSLGEEPKQREAFRGLEGLCARLSDPSNASNPALFHQYGNTHNGKASLLARIFLKLGAWQWALHPGLEESVIQGILTKFKNATDHSSEWAKAWHKWAYFNTEVMNRYNMRDSPAAAARHLVAAVTGYFQSISKASTMKSSDDSLQDILRLLTLWFTHGASAEVQDALHAGLEMISIDTWLVVLPQIIARIHSHIPAVHELTQSLLVSVGHRHPQALMYPLLVACKSLSPARRDAAVAVVDKVRQERGKLVEQAQLVSKELIRVAILWHEMWHEALEEASRLYFGEHNVDAMLNALKPLHEMLSTEGPLRATNKEEAFVQDYGHELAEANECCNKFRRTGKEAELTQAWDLYYHVFRRINKQLPGLTTLELQHVSPALVSARDLELAVPGTYRSDPDLITIREFAPQLIVITSKQRPRKLTIHGSDGVEYVFLLKGHEDLRQDERVMQLFGLVNTLLSNARSTAEKDLSIQRYSVIPLSPNSGLIGWVPNCDTLHHLIREYRDARKVLVNVEHRLMVAFAPDYEHLTLMAKVEVFEHALDNTVGDDLAKVLWLKSRSSEVWLDRRTNYTRSLAVMSMVGYLLGLGDRHPSNLMLDRFSGKILHIDFGDCFEASMNREKFPEKVPFRLTRMLVKAMEVSGIEGNFKTTCENVMQVLRSERDSVMAMMEAFVHDPLINWRLFTLNEVTGGAPTQTTNVRTATGGGGLGELAENPPSPPGRVLRERELREAVGQLGDANEVLNVRAVQVMARMKHKLTGRDFATAPLSPGVVTSVPGVTAPGAPSAAVVDGRDAEPSLSVQEQVRKLIAQARSHENLCQSYVGWCPFW